MIIGDSKLKLVGVTAASSAVSVSRCRNSLLQSRAELSQKRAVHQFFALLLDNRPARRRGLHLGR